MRILISVIGLIAGLALLGVIYQMFISSTVIPLSGPPAVVEIAVSVAENCSGAEDIGTQTTSKSCPFVGGPEDPPDLACQEANTDTANNRFVQFSSDTEFSIEFPGGDPFVNTSGQCSIGTPATFFRCKMRKKDTEPNTIYKYDVVVDTATGCAKDPGIYLIP